MDNFFLRELLAADESEEKAALVAEALFKTLPKETALIARRCSLLHWFDQRIVEALLKDVLSNESHPRNIYEQIKSLPFVEALPWGLAYNDLTREGLLHHYILAQPELLKTSAQLAAPAYKVYREDAKIVAEAVFCYLIAGETALASGLLNELEQEARKQGDQEYIDGLQMLVREAQNVRSDLTSVHTPTLVILLGSTPALVELELCQHMLLLSQEDCRRVAFVSIDTTAEPRELVAFHKAHEGIFHVSHLHISIPTTIDYTIPPDQPLHTYIPSKIPQAFANGAGGIRNNGHVAAALNHTKIKQVLEEALHYLGLLDTVQDDKRPRQIDVNIVAFLGGGTGSGILPDIPVMVRQLLLERLYEQRINLFCILPDWIQGSNYNDISWQKSNTVACLLELLALSLAGDAKRQLTYRKHMLNSIYDVSADTIANEVYLIGRTSLGHVEDTARVVGLDLFQRIMDGSGIGLLEYETWLKRRSQGTTDDRGLPRMFATSCPMEVRFPIQETARAFAQIATSYLLPKLVGSEAPILDIGDEHLGRSCKELATAGFNSAAWHGKLDRPHPHQRHLFDLSSLQQNNRCQAVERLFMHITFPDPEDAWGPASIADLQFDEKVVKARIDRYIEACTSYLNKVSFADKANPVSARSMESQSREQFVERVVSFFVAQYMQSFQGNPAENKPAMNLFRLLRIGSGRDQSASVSRYLLEHLTRIQGLVRNSFAFKEILWLESPRLETSLFLSIFWENEQQKRELEQAINMLGSLTDRNEPPQIQVSRDPHRFQVSYEQHGISLTAISDFFRDTSSLMAQYIRHQGEWYGNHQPAILAQPFPSTYGSNKMPVHNSGEMERLVCDPSALNYQSSRPHARGYGTNLIGRVIRDGLTERQMYLETKIIEILYNRMGFEEVTQEIIGSSIMIDAFSGEIGYHIELGPGGEIRIIRSSGEISLENTADKLVMHLEEAINVLPEQESLRRQSGIEKVE